MTLIKCLLLRLRVVRSPILLLGPLFGLRDREQVEGLEQERSRLLLPRYWTPSRLRSPRPVGRDPFEFQTVARVPSLNGVLGEPVSDPPLPPP